VPSPSKWTNAQIYLILTPHPGSHVWSLCITGPANDPTFGLLVPLFQRDRLSDYPQRRFVDRRRSSLHSFRGTFSALPGRGPFGSQRQRCPRDDYIATNRLGGLCPDHAPAPSAEFRRLGCNHRSKVKSRRGPDRPQQFPHLHHPLTHGSPRDLQANFPFKNRALPIQWYVITVFSHHRVDNHLVADECSSQ
jgi:hypothetical protein